MSNDKIEKEKLIQAINRLKRNKDFKLVTQKAGEQLTKGTISINIMKDTLYKIRTAIEETYTLVDKSDLALCTALHKAYRISSELDSQLHTWNYDNIETLRDFFFRPTLMLDLEKGKSP